MVLEDVQAIKKYYDSILYYYTLCYFSAIKLEELTKVAILYRIITSNGFDHDKKPPKITCKRKTRDNKSKIAFFCSENSFKNFSFINLYCTPSNSK